VIEHLFLGLRRLLEAIALDVVWRLEKVHDALSSLIQPELYVLLLLLLLQVMGTPAGAAALIRVLMVNNLTIVLVVVEFGLRQHL